MIKIGFFLALCSLPFQLLSTSSRATELIEHVKQSIYFAEQHQSQITDKDVLNIPGFSGDKIKHLLNNLCSLPHTSYLEIGCWQGSTCIAALYQNNPSVDQAIAIDNWSEKFPLLREKRVYTATSSPPLLPTLRKWGTPKEEFLKNAERFLTQNALTLIEQDCFLIDKSTVFAMPITTYFYDGEHSIENHERAFTYFNDIFENIFIAIVDDWNWKDVREGTLAAFAKLQYEILFQQEIPTLPEEKTGWWNGLYIAVIQKAT